MLIVPRAMTLGEFCEAVDGKTITVRNGRTAVTRGCG